MFEIGLFGIHLSLYLKWRFSWRLANNVIPFRRSSTFVKCFY